MVETGSKEKWWRRVVKRSAGDGLRRTMVESGVGGGCWCVKTGDENGSLALIVEASDEDRYEDR